MIGRKQIGCGLFALGVAIAVCAGAKLPELPPREPPSSMTAGSGDRVEQQATASPQPETSMPETSMPETRTVRERFPDTLPEFFVGVAVAIFGLVLWRAGARPATDLSEVKDGMTDPADPLVILQRLQQPLGKLAAEFDDLQPESQLGALDDLNERFVMPLVESRQRVIDQLGMSAGAEVLVTAAVGERMLNRAWSATADGHQPEARISLSEAVHAFREADRLAQHRG
jgi:hypothetical protein